MDIRDLVLGLDLRRIVRELLLLERHDEEKQGDFGIAIELVESVSAISIMVSIPAEYRRVL